MALVFKILLCAALCFWLFISCQKKKSPGPGLESWLETHFPGRFHILSTENDDVIRNLSFKVKVSIVAEKARPELQAQLRYDLRVPELELDSAAVSNAFQFAEQYWKDAASLLKSLQTAGATDVSLGARMGRITILFFDQPTPAKRHEYLLLLQKALDTWKPSINGYQLDINIADPSARTSANMPLSEQLELTGIGRKKLIFGVSALLDEPFQASQLEKEWKLNPDSERFEQISQRSRQAAQDWLQQHPGKPCEWSDLSEFEQKENSPSVLIFTYSCLDPAQKNSETEEAASERIEVTYNVDEDKISGIKKL